MRKVNFLLTRLTLLFIAILVQYELYSQCYSSFWRNASNFTTDNSIGVYDFTNPSNTASSDNNRASASSLVAILSGNTYYLKATGFGFSIPAYAAICGVTVEIECRATGLILTAAIRDNDIRLIKNGVISGNDHSLAGDWSSSDSYRTYGNGNDLWGVTLLPSDVNASNFGVAISARIIALVAALPDAEIDHIRMRIDYNPILPVTLEYFNGFRKENTIYLQWKTTEEEYGASITLQRTFKDQQWLDLKKVELNSIGNGGVYHYNDTIPPASPAQYRLKILLASGQVSYSDIRNFDANTPFQISAYPNPATDRIVIRGINHVIRDLAGRRWNVPSIQGIGHMIYIVSELPAGFYFANNSNETIRFQKW